MFINKINILICGVYIYIGCLRDCLIQAEEKKIL